MADSNATSMFQSIGGDLIGNSINNTASGLINQLFGGWNARRQWKYTRKQMELQQKYALERMQQEYDYQRQVFDYTNEYNDPSNVLNRFSAAGINPAAVYGSGNISSPTTMSSSPGGSGSGVGSTTATPGGGMPTATSPGTAELNRSQAIRNLAEGDYYRNAATNQSEQALSESAYRLLLNAKIGETAAKEYLLKQEGIIKTAVASLSTDKANTELALLKANVDEIVASADLKEAQVTEVRSRVLFNLMNAACTMSQTELNAAQRSYLLSLAADKNYQIQGNLKEFTLPYKDPQTGKVTTYTLDGYAAEGFIKSLGAIRALYENYVSSVNADWANPEKWNDAIQGYVGSIGDLLESIANVVFKGKLGAAAAANAASNAKDSNTREKQLWLNEQEFVNNAQWRNFQKDMERRRYNRESYYYYRPHRDDRK